MAQVTCIIYRYVYYTSLETVYIVNYYAQAAPYTR